MTDDDARRIVQRQTDAWNARDADAFAACYAPGAIVRSFFEDGERALAGRDAIRESYAARFAAAPTLRVQIEHRHVHDGIVTDLEYFPACGLRATAVFRVRDGLIDRAWLLAARGPGGTPPR